MNTTTNHYRGFRPLLSGLLLAPFMTASLLAGGKEPVAVAPAASQPDDSGWEFSVAPYGWALGINGTTGVGDMLTDIDIDSMEILNHVDFFFSSRPKPAGGVGDCSSTATTPNCPVAARPPARSTRRPISP